MKVDTHKIKYELIKRGLTQTWLADELGVSKQSLSKWLKEPGGKNMAKLSEVARALNMNETDLLTSN